MKVDHRYRVHLAASKNETCAHLAQPWLDTKGKRLIGTDGWVLAIVPVDLDKGDKPGAIPNGAARKARWQRVSPLVGRVFCSGVDYTRPKVKFPDVDAVVPKWDAGSPGTVTVLLDPRHLLRLARAIGVQEGGGVALTILLPKKGQGVTTAIRVREDGHRENAAWGLLMPRKAPTPKPVATPAKAPRRRK